MSRLSVALSLLVVCVALFACNVASVEYEVVNGVGTPSLNWTMITVYPQTLTIRVNDSVLFRVLSEAHTVTFPREATTTLIEAADQDFVYLNYLVVPTVFVDPAVPPSVINVDVTAGALITDDTDPNYRPASCGFMLPEFAGGYQCRVTFRDPGTYTYQDILHGNGGTVIVVDASSSVTVDDPAAVLADIAAQTAADLAATSTYETTDGLPWAQDPNDPNVYSRTNNEWILTAGWVDSSLVAAFQRFMPYTLRIELGDSVQMLNRFPGHVHTFNLGPNFIPQDQPVFVDTRTPPTLAFPSTHYPINVPDEPNYLGNLDYYTGVLAAGQFKVVTFNEPGTYIVTCEFHVGDGMNSTIEVVDSCACCQTDSAAYSECRALVPGARIPDGTVYGADCIKICKAAALAPLLALALVLALLLL